MLSAGRQFKLKNRASARTGRHPDPTIVALDDRLADRKTHSHPVSLGREHGFKKAIEVGQANSAPGVRDRDAHAIVSGNFRFYREYASPPTIPRPTYCSKKP